MEPSGLRSRVMVLVVPAETREIVSETVKLREKSSTLPW